MSYINFRKLRRMVASKQYGPRGTVRHLSEAIEQGELNTDDFSLRELAEGLVPDGREWVDSLKPGGGGSFIMEAGHAVDTSLFSAITGQLISSTMLGAYNAPEYLWPQLCVVIPTKISGEKIVGIEPLGAQAKNIKEGDPYPTAGLSASVVETPETEKEGVIIPVTKEAVFEDRTGQILSRAAELGTSISVSREEAILGLVTGATNTYKRNGTSYNTYAASGGHDQVNQIVDVLTDYTDIDVADKAFDVMTDWETGLPIMMTPNTLLIPRALKMTAHRILNATEVRYDPNVSAGTAQNVQLQANPVAGQFSILSSPWVKRVTSSDTNWFYGEPKKAFAYMENWGPTTTQAAPNSEADFRQDIVAQFKISEKGTAAVLDPLYMLKSTGAG